MRTGKRPLKSVGALLAALAFGAGAFLLLPGGDPFSRSFFLSRIERASGLEAHASAMEFNPVSGKLEIRNLVLSQPKGFPGREMAAIRRLTARFHPAPFLKSRSEILELELDISSVTAVRNGFRIVNLQVLPARGESPVIRRLSVRFAQVDFLDYAGVEEPLVHNIPLDFERTFEGVRGPGAAVYLIAEEILGSSGLARIDTVPPSGETAIAPPVSASLQGPWTFEDTARGTASAVLGGIRATTGRIAELIAPRASGPDVRSRMPERPAAEAPVPKS